jgi:hypothetical protein
MLGNSTHINIGASEDGLASQSESDQAGFVTDESTGALVAAALVTGEAVVIVDPDDPGTAPQVGQLVNWSAPAQDGTLSQSLQ